MNPLSSLCAVILIALSLWSASPMVVAGEGSLSMTSTDDMVQIYGWAFIGDDIPFTGASAVLTNARGKVVPGSTTRTGASGEFIITVHRSALPKRVQVAVGRGFVDRDARGPKKSRRLAGWLRAPVDMDGPETGLVYVTPLSTLAVNLTPRYRNYEKASARARWLMGMPRLVQSSFEPWADGSASLQHLEDLVDGERLLMDINQEGGLSQWLADMRHHDLFNQRQGYGPRKPPIATEANSVDSERATANSVLGILGTAWGVVADLAKTCNPSQTKLPGLGALATWLQDSGVVQRDPACDLEEKIGNRIDKLGEQLSTMLDQITAQLDAIQSALTQQSQQLAKIETVVRQTASDNAFLTLSNSVAAIRTVQERRRLLAHTIFTYSKPQSAENPNGLGMTLNDIRSSNDPRAQNAAQVIAMLGREAYGTSVTGWDIAGDRLAELGVLLPGPGGNGAVRLAWNAMWAEGGVPEQLSMEFNKLVNYYRDLWVLYSIQEIDVLRGIGVPLNVINGRVALREPMHNALIALMTPPNPIMGIATPGRCPLSLTYLDRNGIYPTNPFERCFVSNSRFGLPPSSTPWNIRMTQIYIKPNEASIRACALPALGVRTGILRLTVNSTHVAVSVPRCDSVPQATSPPWPPQFPSKITYKLLTQEDFLGKWNSNSDMVVMQPSTPIMFSITPP